MLRPVRRCFGVLWEQNGSSHYATREHTSLTTTITRDRDYAAGLTVAEEPVGDEQGPDRRATYADMILSRCHSPITTTWSRHSRRIEPITRSAYAFCHGERGAMTTSRTSNTSWLDAKIVRYSSARLLVASGDPRPWRALRRDMPGHRRSRRRAGEPPQRAAAGGKWPCACRSEASRRRHGFIQSGPIGHSGLIRSENLPSPYGPSRPVLPERRRSTKLAPPKGAVFKLF
jgi:hypothetical protein